MLGLGGLGGGVGLVQSVLEPLGLGRALFHLGVQALNTLIGQRHVLRNLFHGLLGGSLLSFGPLRRL